MGEVVRRARSFRVLTRAHLTADGSSTVGAGSKEIQEFQNWIQTAAQQLVVGKTGAESWVGVYVRAAYARGWYRAESMIQRSAIPNADRPLALTVGAATELEGIVAETYRQISRVFIDAVARAARPRELAGLVADRIEKILVTRGRAMAQFAVVKAHNRATLDAFRDAGVRRVGIDPEYLPKPKAKTTLDSMFVRDAKTRKLKASRRKATKTAADDPEIVDILTAGDDLVCQQCEDIADSGPYDIDTAQDLIPAHPNCRCAFVPSFDQRFAHDAGPPDEERDDHGRWTTGGQSVDIKKVRTSQARSETNKEQVQHYRDQIRNKEKLTPLEVVLNKETGNYHLLDGHHRLYAAKAEGLTHVRVRVAHRADSTRDTNEYIRAMRFG